MYILSNSIGVSIPGELCRRLQLWTISRYSKIACELDTSLPPPAVQQLDLHRAPERFDHGVIEAIPGSSPSTARGPRRGREERTPRGGLGAVVRVDQRARFGPTVRARHA